MPATATIAGISIGLFVQLYSNAIRKLPLNHHPWEHILYAGIGAYSANWLVDWEEKTEQELREILAEREKSNKRMPREKQLKTLH